MKELELLKDEIRKELIRNKKFVTGKSFREVSIEEVDEGIKINYGDGIFFIEKGKKANTKMPPYKAIIPWAKKLGLSDGTSDLFLIRRAIGRNSRKGINIIEPALNRWLNEYGEKYFLSRFIKELDKKIRK